jgi:hypothetical protein
MGGREGNVLTGGRNSNRFFPHAGQLNTWSISIRCTCRLNWFVESPVCCKLFNAATTNSILSFAYN